MYSDGELFDILDETGARTGEVMPRGEVHTTGALHGSVHVWLVSGAGADAHVLLQKRAADKDSFPSCLDAACTGHIDSGEEPLAAAVRELSEEIGVQALPSELIPLFRRRVSEDNVFHGKRFINNEITWVYLYRGGFALSELRFEKAEISALEELPAQELRRRLREGGDGLCIDRDEFEEVMRCAEDMNRAAR